MLFSEKFLVPQFLNQYGPKPGDVVVLYDVAGRKVYFWKNNGTAGWELLFPARGYRKKPVTVKKTDIRVRINKDGSISTGEVVSELVVKD